MVDRQANTENNRPVTFDSKERKRRRRIYLGSYSTSDTDCFVLLVICESANKLDETKSYK